MKKYKKLKWSKLHKNEPYNNAVRCNDNHKLFVIGSGKGTKEFFYVMENIHKNNYNNEYVYLDRKREVIVRTKLYAGVGMVSCEGDILEWITTYNSEIDQHEIDIQRHREEALVKARKARSKH
jgi:hypothetical protein